MFALDTPPSSQSSRPLPVEGGAAGRGGGGGGGGGGEGVGEIREGRGQEEEKAGETGDRDKGVTIARVSAVIGKVGLYGAFDGHGGSSCASFVSRNLPQGVKNSPAWARLLAGHDHDDITTPDRGEDAEEKSTGYRESQQAAQQIGGAAHDGGGGGFDDLLVGVMREAVQDGFRSTQEAFARHTRPGKNSGSTATVAIVCGRQVVIANLGDSGGLFHNDQDTMGGDSLTAKTEVCRYTSYVRSISTAFQQNHLV